ncbi:MAG: Na+/H+ antiporter NhaA [Bacteroidetes bacterium GWE2_41_25]|nr:MAG: Na+/H+ antiporter NhaA [Bacteroidetes bacterium GWA2_40_15]OFY11326.1 MAG: Na+/H+ antiporter NhaA [Bacteroidetes bacterium GWE2_41_25]OFY56700.1 MAG: Na+/H+ antiporter NhaA [Bacteroidetes bacterium GWF2_41_9]HBH85423.1 Na+/H+ antiporter NhaA [Bacteroidales bacterium]HBQ83753.1 Na+/H+ antiporter NhaA [Bacteroidales bacterium]
METTRLFNEFFNSEKAGGIVLVLATIVSIVLANSKLGNTYIEIWNYDLGGHSLVHWINDGLMTIFFLLIGLELEREFYEGELSNLRTALLPVFSALGGMIIPAGIFIALNYGKETIAGTGIPMATDIAFAIGILSLLGSRVPASLKIFLTALAIFDDLGAIILIAVFYTATLLYANLLIALGIFFLLIILNRLGVRNLIPYLVLGILMWYFTLHSGVHASIAGVLLAFVVPYGEVEEKSPSDILQHHLHKPVAFIILPLFALANTCIVLGGNWYTGLDQPLSLGIIAGLVIGKPLGIALFSLLAVALGLCALPYDMKWKNVIGAGMLGGIGFTMSIFIAIVGLDNGLMIDKAKIAILVASIISGIAGYFWLRVSLPK